VSLAHVPALDVVRTLEEDFRVGAPHELGREPRLGSGRRDVATRDVEALAGARDEYAVQCLVGGQSDGDRYPIEARPRQGAFRSASP
jgi:predicted proteasome-type protease